MGLPIVENLSGLQESMFSLFRGTQLNSHKKSNKHVGFYEFLPLPLLAHVGPTAVRCLGLLLFVPLLEVTVLTPAQASVTTAAPVRTVAASPVTTSRVASPVTIAVAG